MTPPRHDVFTWRGRTMIDRDGQEIGTVKEIYLDQQTGQPEWALVVGARRSAFVPLLGASPAADVIQTGYENAVVKNAPNVEADLEPSDAEEAALCRHYRLRLSDARPHSGLRRTQRFPGPAGQGRPALR